MQAKLTRVNGQLKIDINGSIYEPLSFKSFRPTARNISDFHKAGVRLFSILTSGLKCILGVPYSPFGESWVGPGQYDFSVIDRQIDLFVENAPEGYFALMIQLDTRQWWLNSHENYPNSFTHLSQMASRTDWREAAADYLQAALRHVEEKYGERIYGYFLLCGTTTEWFSDRDYEASHPFKEEAYRLYTGDENARIPSPEQLDLPEDVGFNHDKNVQRYRRFHAEQTTDTILYFVRKTREVTGRSKLIGLYYGYLFELAGARMWNAGHLDYERIFLSDEIDMISSPSHYGYRGPLDTSNFMVTYHTLDQHDKLYYLEFDHITHLAPSHIEGYLIPGGNSKCKNQTETLNLMQRDFMLCASRGAALWWFDMFEGWFYSDEMMESIRQMIETAKRLSKHELHSAAQIAVIASGEALYGVNKHSRVNNKLLIRQLDGLARMGAPYDLYSAGDIALALDQRYRLVIFLDMLETTSAFDAVVDELKQSGRTLLWMYAPRWLNGGMDETQNTVEMTLGMADHAQAVDVPAQLMPSPRLCINDEGAEVLARYDTGKPAIARKQLDGHTSVFSAVGQLGGEVLMRIAQEAGVHIYCRNHPVYVNNRLVGVYSFEETQLTVPVDGEYEDLFTGTRYTSQSGVLTLGAAQLASRLLLRLD